jgi:hypothetical protein
MGDKHCSQSVNTTREVIAEIEVNVMDITATHVAKRESAETLTADIDIQKFVLSMQDIMDVRGRKSVRTNTIIQKEEIK